MVVLRSWLDYWSVVLDRPVWLLLLAGALIGGYSFWRYLRRRDDGADQ